MDRFMVRVSMGYPEPQDEVTMLLQRQGSDPLQELEPVVSAEELAEMRQLVAKTYISEEVARYVVNLIDATRRSELLLRGASPRATLATVALSKAVAQLRGRDFVVPKDVQEVFVTTVSHRLQLSPQADNQSTTVQEILATLLTKVHPPKLR